MAFLSRERFKRTKEGAGRETKEKKLELKRYR